MNTRTERARDDARERGTKEEERKGPAFLFICHTLLPGSSSTLALDGRRFESAISRRARKLRRLDHSEAGLEKATVLAPPDAFIFSLRPS